MSSLLSSKVAALSRQLSRTTLQCTHMMGKKQQGPELSRIISSYRSFATKKLAKRGNTKKTPVHISSREPRSKLGGGDDAVAALQHQEWVKFQQSIAVEGFETGQVVEAKVVKKTRGGKHLRRGGGAGGSAQTALEKKVEERQRLTEGGGGLFPPLRYSDEETERLLSQAYAALPERGGKRGTRNLKRQHYRWHLVRQIRKKYKFHMGKHQERKMLERSKKVADVKQVLNGAPAIVARDRAYQASVLQHWARTMVQSQDEQSAASATGTTMQSST